MKKELFEELLGNVKQGRLKPEGPAKVLLMVAVKHPEILLNLTGRTRKRAYK